MENLDHIHTDDTQLLINKLFEVFPVMNHERRVAFLSEVISLFGTYVRDNGQFLLDISEVAEKNGFYVRLNDPQLFSDKISELFPTMEHDLRVALFSKMISVFGPYIRDNGQFMFDIYEEAERSGVHVLPVHYYSPIPETSSYPKGDALPLLIEKNFGLDIPPASQNSFFTQVCQFAEELVDVPFDHRNSSEMHWDNGMFGIMDSCVYYAMIRQYRPPLVLEIGSGFSTLVASKAALKNETTLIECIEPYPIEFFSRHLCDMKEIKLTVALVQDIPLEKFSSLEKNDILFIDSSHVVKSGSDAEYLLFRVLPALPSGVIVHFHDIYLPYSYPRSNLEHHKRFWNENYVLGAYLANNAEWEILVSNCTLSTENNIQTLCERLSVGDDSLTTRLKAISPGGSLWIQKR